MNTDGYWTKQYDAYHRPTSTRDITAEFDALIGVQDEAWVEACERVSDAARAAGF